MPDNHVGEAAELYALGALDETATARLGRHVRDCDLCARRVGDAESAVLRLIESGDVSAERPEELDRRLRLGNADRRPWWSVAVAAAFLIGLLPWGVERMQRNAAFPPERLAATAMLAGHFNHAALRALRSDAPNAKVIYPRSGGWIYVLVAPGATQLDVVIGAGGRLKIVASLPGSQQTRTAFVRYPGRLDEAELLEDGAPVASVRLRH